MSTTVKIVLFSTLGFAAGFAASHFMAKHKAKSGGSAAPAIDPKTGKPA